MVEARRRYDEGWLANRPYSADDAIDDLVATLGVDLDEAQRRRVLDTFTGLEGGGVPSLNPHVPEVLAAAKEAGLRIGIVCDVGLVPSTGLRGYLDHHGVLGFFDHVDL